MAMHSLVQGFIPQFHGRGDLQEICVLAYAVFLPNEALYLSALTYLCVALRRNVIF